MSGRLPTAVGAGVIDTLPKPQRCDHVARPSLPKTRFVARKGLPTSDGGQVPCRLPPGALMFQLSECALPHPARVVQWTERCHPTPTVLVTQSWTFLRSGPKIVSRETLALMRIPIKGLASRPGLIRAADPYLPDPRRPPSVLGRRFAGMAVRVLPRRRSPSDNLSHHQMERPPFFRVPYSSNFFWVPSEPAAGPISNSCQIRTRCPSIILHYRSLDVIGSP